MEAKRWPLPRPFPTGTTLYHRLIVVSWADDAEDHGRGVEDPPRPPPSSGKTACTVSEEKSTYGRPTSPARPSGRSAVIFPTCERPCSSGKRSRPAGLAPWTSKRLRRGRPVVLTNDDASCDRPHRETRRAAAGPISWWARADAWTAAPPCDGAAAGAAVAGGEARRLRFMVGVVVS